jgi:hypothetical protein
MSTARWIFPVAATVAALIGCTGTTDLASAPGNKGNDNPGGVTVVPPSATLPPYGNQAFAATPPTVTWSVKEVGGGNITTGGFYTAPATTGQYTVLVFEPVSATTVQVPITVTSSPPGTYQGLTVPTTHPRLWFDATRLAAAKTWYATHSFTPDASPYGEDDYLGWALRGLFTNSASDCRRALDGLGTYANQGAIPMNAYMAQNGGPNAGPTMSDYARWYGQQVISTYDWCWFAMTPAERTTFITNANTWIDGRRLVYNGWGDVPMHQNNYYWGFLRNEIMWGIVSYEDSPPYPGDARGRTYAQVFLDDAIERRYVNDFIPASQSIADSLGGVGQEGSEYGPYMINYPTMPFATAAMMGRDLYSATNFWKEAVYPLIYQMTPAPTTCEAPTANLSMGYTYLLNSDISFFGSGYPALDANFMTQAAMMWPGTAVGGHARQFLATAGLTGSRWLASVDPGGTPRSFSTLPLDYYAPAIEYLYSRTGWGTAATLALLQFGVRNSTYNGGHQHVDWGSFQLWRNGRFLTRESPGYTGGSLAGYGGSGSVDVSLGFAHNVLLVAGNPIALDPYSHYSQEAVVRRLESQPGYAYAAVDLSNTRGTNSSRANAHFVTWVREFWFLRGLETLVVLDRVESSGASDVKTFLVHCERSPTADTDANGNKRSTCTVGTQSLVTTTLLPAPANVVHNVRAEGGSGSCSGCQQYRVEVDTSPGTAQSYILTVLQGKDASAAALAPTVTDNGASSSFTLTLDANNSITFNKGMTSSGGSITLGGASNALRTTVQGISVTDAGPVWQ